MAGLGKFGGDFEEGGEAGEVLEVGRRMWGAGDAVQEGG
jgi:hypothetical protein